MPRVEQAGKLGIRGLGLVFRGVAGAAALEGFGLQNRVVRS